MPGLALCWPRSNPAMVLLQAPETGGQLVTPTDSTPGSARRRSVSWVKKTRRFSAL
jgi:hypothetical protein